MDWDVGRGGGGEGVYYFTLHGPETGCSKGNRLFAAGDLFTWYNIATLQSKGHTGARRTRSSHQLK